MPEWIAATDPSGYEIKKKVYENVPFVNVDVDAKSTSYWDVAATGDWGSDFKLGEEYASIALDHVQHTDLPVVMGKIVRDMPRQEDFGGIETGFIDRLTYLALQLI